jgi:hypothetical protein
MYNFTMRLVLITGKSFTGKFEIFFFTVTGFKLDHFTRFYLKLAGKTPTFTPKSSSLLDKQPIIENQSC